MIKSLVEAQQANSPNHTALKLSLQRLNEENRILQNRIQEQHSTNADNISKANPGIVVVDKEAMEKQELEKKK